MRESNIVFLTYITMVGVPLLMWVMSVTGPFPFGHALRAPLLLLIGVGSLVFGAVGINEVFLHGKKE